MKNIDVSKRSGISKPPWRVVRANPGPTSGEWMIAGSTPGYLAEVRDCGSGNVASNAKLIAAAPDILNALIDLRDWYEAYTGVPACDANNAISLATKVK